MKHRNNLDPSHKRIVPLDAPQDASESPPMCGGVPMKERFCRACDAPFWAHPEDENPFCSASCARATADYPTTANPMKHRNKNLLTPGFPRRADRKAAIREGIMCAAVVVFLLAFLVFAPGS